VLSRKWGSQKGGEGLGFKAWKGNTTFVSSTLRALRRRGKDSKKQTETAERKRKEDKHDEKEVADCFSWEPFAGLFPKIKK